ncbi:MAG: hypothetical protein ABI824_19750 [Acidobacteriota bacterium]
MYIPINLSTEPFRRDRPIFLASVACALLLAGLLVAQGLLFWNEHSSAEETRRSVDSMRTQLATIQTEQSKVTTTLQDPVNSEVLVRSYLLNGLVQRKSISWARLLADIEGVLPDKVRVIQVRLPQVNAHNEVTLDMEVGSQQPEQMVEFIKKLEGSPLFGAVSLARSDPPTQNEPLFRYRLTVSYGQKL